MVKDRPYIEVDDHPTIPARKSKHMFGMVHLCDGNYFWQCVAIKFFSLNIAAVAITDLDPKHLSA